MIIGTLFTLFVLPAIYILIAKDHRGGSGDEETEKLMRELELEPVEA
jgi:multidrug efflux pump